MKTKIKPWMYGAGVLGVVGVGIIAYEVTKGSGAGAGAGGSGAKAPITPGAAPPIVNTPRPPAPTGTFTPTQPPSGPNVTVLPGILANVDVPDGQSLTLVLPSGAKWTRVRFATVVGQNPQVVNGQVNLGGNLTSSVSISSAQLTGSTIVVAEWIDSTGAVQATAIPFTLQKVVHLHP
jgi:hypothetical protein